MLIKDIIKTMSYIVFNLSISGKTSHGGTSISSRRRRSCRSGDDDDDTDGATSSLTATFAASKKAAFTRAKVGTPPNFIADFASRQNTNAETVNKIRRDANSIGAEGEDELNKGNQGNRKGGRGRSRCRLRKKM